MFVIGIDPGAKGGWTVLDMLGEVQEYGALGDAYEMSKKIDESGYFQDAHFFVEKAQSMGLGSPRSMFNYGNGFGQLQGVLIAYDMKHTLIPPQSWYKIMHKGCKEKTTKLRSLEAAKRLFPKVSFILPGCKKPHDGIYEAALIAEYGRRLLQGK